MPAEEKPEQERQTQLPRTNLIKVTNNSKIVSQLIRDDVIMKTNLQPEKSITNILCDVKAGHTLTATGMHHTAFTLGI